MIPRRGDR